MDATDRSYHKQPIFQNTKATGSYLCGIFVRESDTEGKDKIGGAIRGMMHGGNAAGYRGDDVEREREKDQGCARVSDEGENCLLTAC